LIIVAIAVAAALAIQILPAFTIFVVGQLAIVIIVTVAMTILMGGAGLLSLASAAFLALGGYGVLLAMERLGLPLPLAALLVVACSIVVGGLLGMVALRLSGFQLAIVTFGFLQLLLAVLKRGGAWIGGGYGLVTPAIEAPLWGPITTADFAALAVFLMVLTVAAGASVMRSRVGRAWLALRDNEAAARMQGIDVNRFRIVAFAFSSGLISLAGVLHPLLLGITNPSAYLVDLSIFHVTLVVVGGMTGSMIGAVVAPILLYFIPESIGSLGPWRDVFYAAILLIALIIMPQGIASWARSSAIQLRNRMRRVS